MKDGRGSSTAELVATLRAAHQILDGEPKILVDPVAIRLIHQSSVDLIHKNPGKLHDPLLTVLRALVVMRSRFAEDELKEAVQRGIRQYVVLGAGLDTFAYRQPPFAAPLQIFEVDHPASQKAKLDRLSSADIHVPENVVFVPVDFERMDLQNALVSKGFDQELPTFFSWLGVLAYLTPSAIESTLRFVASLPSPNGIVLSTFMPDSALSGIDLKVAEFLTANLAARGEPVLTKLLPSEAVDMLRSYGFSRVYDLLPEVSAKRYFSQRSDRLRQPLFARLYSATR